MAHSLHHTDSGPGVLPAVAPSVITAPTDPYTYNYNPYNPANYNQLQYYFQPPPYIETTLKYQNVNADHRLQEKITTYFLDKTIYWIKKEKSFKIYKKYLKYLNDEEDGYKIMHKLLKILVRKGNTNWYDLKAQEYVVKDYIYNKLENL